MRHALTVLVVGLLASVSGCGGSDAPALESDALAPVDVVAVEDTAVAPSDTAPPLPDTTMLEDVVAEVSVDVGTLDAAVDSGLYGPYPAGPYGNKVGDTVQNFSWRGYVNEKADAISTTKPIVNTTLDALRRTAKRPFALLHVSEFT